MDIRKTRTCEKCKASVPLDKVKLYPRTKDQNWLLCEACCEQTKAKVSQQIVSNFPKKSTSTITNNVITRMPGDLTKPFQPKESREEKPVLDQRKKIILNTGKPATAPALQTKNVNEFKAMSCTRCKYNFKIDPMRANVLYNVCCPYCGKDDRLDPPNKR